MRRSCGCLKYGSLVWRNAEPQTLGFLAFSRIDSGKETVIIINPSYSSTTIPPIPVDNVINYDQPFHTYVNLLNPSQKATIGYSGTQAYLYLPTGFQVSPQSFLIFVDSNNVNYDPNLSLCKS